MDCPYVPSIEYGDFSLRLHEKAGTQRIPLIGSLELGYRCNLRCQHCYVAHAHTGLPGRQELTAAEIQRILDEVVDEGCLWFLLTGGEPLLRRDFPEIYLYAKRKGLLLNLFTNGTLLTPQLADLLAEWRPFNIEITLYGATQETYERVTGIPGSHAHAMRGIELLLERNLPLKLKTMLMTLNIHELEAMKAFTRNLGLDFRYDAMLHARLDGSHKPHELRLSPQQVVQLDVEDPERMRSWHEFCDLFVAPPPDTPYLYRCGAGIKSFHIDPYGQLSLCITSREPSYDLRQGSFHEGWVDFLYQARYEPLGESYACAECALKSLCGQCPGLARLEAGDPKAKLEYHCQVAHLRARAFGIAEELMMENQPLDRLEVG
ncbi:MAG: radical SAM protein [Anaerolineales bacterium]|nr:radical SAM protein [Anaerolineales bacterium]